MLLVNGLPALRGLGSLGDKVSMANTASVLLQLLCLGVLTVGTDHSETSCHLGWSQRPLHFLHSILELFQAAKVCLLLISMQCLPLRQPKFVAYVD